MVPKEHHHPQKRKIKNRKLKVMPNIREDFEGNTNYQTKGQKVCIMFLRKQIVQGLAVKINGL